LRKTIKYLNIKIKIKVNKDKINSLSSARL